MIGYIRYTQNPEHFWPGLTMTCDRKHGLIMLLVLRRWDSKATATVRWLFHLKYLHIVVAR